MDDITVYTFMVAQLSQDSAPARDLWCSADRIKAYDDWMLRSKAPPLRTKPALTDAARRRPRQAPRRRPGAARRICRRQQERRLHAVRRSRQEVRHGQGDVLGARQWGGTLAVPPSAVA